jgi:hypothetical protein
MCVAGFPNFFMMYGPNTNLGHNSILFMLECQASYILRCIAETERRGCNEIDVSPEAMAQHCDRIQAELGETVWARIERSWYKNDAGRIVNNWPGTTFQYWRETRRPDFAAFRFATRRAEDQRAASAA